MLLGFGKSFFILCCLGTELHDFVNFIRFKDTPAWCGVSVLNCGYRLRCKFMHTVMVANQRLVIGTEIPRDVLLGPTFCGIDAFKCRGLILDAGVACSLKVFERYFERLSLDYKGFITRLLL
ncbi:hypothetical protein AYI70_g10126 [Smittium culicis]|uniref:C3H1-type domain-containing protein n=1 Tax=Smittium culicis TaxID=133412 RepID=A0A1R1X814_9FUNG|nr:hypothetical protein AYI70_g10126 [Smittium culicis]